MYKCDSCKNKGNEEYCGTCITTATPNDFVKPIPTNWERDYAKVDKVKHDSVCHPNHYCTGNIEVIDYIEDKLSKEELQGYFTGNIIKYVSRFKHKNGVQDLKKAAWYLDRMIKNMGEEKGKTNE